MGQQDGSRSAAKGHALGEDISRILKEWPWDPANTVRRVVGEDGRERVQIRVFMQGYHGILQFDCDDRPDGERPHGRDFALDYYREQTASAPDSQLNEEQAKELFEEGMMVYQRYVVLFQMGDYARVVRDTERNMELFQFVRERAEREEDRNYLEKWWPYILRMHGMAKAMLRLQMHQVDDALTCVRETIDRIEALPEVDDETFVFERNRSIEVLTELRTHIEDQRPLSEIEVLERIKSRAIEQEKYELAARIRDQLSELRGDGDGPERGERR